MLRLAMHTICTQWCVLPLGCRYNIVVSTRLSNSFVSTLVIFLLESVLFEWVVGVSGREGLTLLFFNIEWVFCDFKIGSFFACLSQGGLHMNLKLASLSLTVWITYFFQSGTQILLQARIFTLASDTIVWCCCSSQVFESVITQIKAVNFCVGSNCSLASL